MGKVYIHVDLTDVLCVPSLKQSLLSVACLVQEGYTAIFKRMTCIISKKGTCVKSAAKDGLHSG